MSARYNIDDIPTRYRYRTAALSRVDGPLLWPVNYESQFVRSLYFVVIFVSPLLISLCKPFAFQRFVVRKQLEILGLTFELENLHKLNKICASWTSMGRISGGRQTSWSNLANFRLVQALWKISQKAPQKFSKTIPRAPSILCSRHPLKRPKRCQRGGERRWD